MPTKSKPVIAVIGASKCSKKLRDMAAQVGKYVAENGGIIVCGGMGGIMEGAARGAKEGGGVTIGILPSDDKKDANPYVDFAIPTGFGEGRNIIVVRTADVVVALPGKYGTLSEMAFARLFNKPVISISAWKLGDDIIQVEDPIEAARLALELAGRKK